jgi:hypothetical protein
MLASSFVIVVPSGMWLLWQSPEDRNADDADVPQMPADQENICANLPNPRYLRAIYPL